MRATTRKLVTRHSSLEGALAGDLPADDQRVDVVRPLVGVHGLEVREVANRLILGEDAVRSEQAPGLARDEFTERVSAAIEEATNRLVKAGREEQVRLVGFSAPIRSQN